MSSESVDFMECQTDGSWKCVTATFTNIPSGQLVHPIPTAKSDQAVHCHPYLDPRTTLADIRRYCDAKGIKVKFSKTKAIK